MSISESRPLPNSSSALVPSLLQLLGLVPKIAGGKNSQEHETDYIVRLNFLDDPKTQCGGSIIQAMYILTAAHCVYSYWDNPGNITVTAGDYDRSVKEGYEQERAVSQVIVHENYDSSVLSNDIALLKLSSGLNLTSERVKPIDYENEPSDYIGSGTIWGWGKVSKRSSLSKILQRADIPFQNCSDHLPSNITMTHDKIMCAGVPGKDACKGDSGGPLTGILTRSSHLMLLGIISIGPECVLSSSRHRRPGIFTNVSQYGTWIDQKTGTRTYSTTQCSGSDNNYYCRGSMKCISRLSVCNGVNDCGDNEDEENCYENCNSDRKFLCQSKQGCIPLRWVCDGDNDCGDHQDEANCENSGNSSSCPPERPFKCKWSENCIKISWICDGDRDCPYSDDEANCHYVLSA